MFQLGGEVLYNILIEFGIPMKQAGLTKVCLNEMYSTVWIGKYLSDMFSITIGLRQGDALSPLLFRFALQPCFSIYFSSWNHKNLQKYAEEHPPVHNKSNPKLNTIICLSFMYSARK